jgi:hypothetical protein
MRHQAPGESCLCYRKRTTGIEVATCFGLPRASRSHQSPSCNHAARAIWVRPGRDRAGMAAIHAGAASLIDAIEALLPDAGEVDVEA